MTLLVKTKNIDPLGFVLVRVILRNLKQLHFTRKKKKKKEGGK